MFRRKAQVETAMTDEVELRVAFGQALEEVKRLTTVIRQNTDQLEDVVDSLERKARGH